MLISKATKWLLSIIELVMIMMLFSFSISYSSNNLYFIRSGPIKEYLNTARIPYETQIYEFDEVDLTLKLVWSMGDNIEASKVGIYDEPKSLLLYTVTSDINSVYIIPMDSISAYRKIDLGSEDYIIDCHYFDMNDSKDIISVSYFKHYTDKKQDKILDLYTVDGQKADIDNKENGIYGLMRLSGSGPDNASINDDYIHADIRPDGEVRTLYNEFDWNIPPVPDGTIKRGSSRGWNLLVNEPGYVAITSVPDNNGLKDRELLIYDKIKDAWRSSFVNGAETSLRLINGWLIGRVTNINPKSDYESYKGYHGIWSDSILFIRPDEEKAFYLELDKNYKILWVENDILYYRMKNKLYKAVIKDNILTSEQLLIQSTAISYTYWAFRGTTRPSPKEIKDKKID